MDSVTDPVCFVMEPTYRELPSHDIASQCGMLVSIPNETTPNNSAGGGQSCPKVASQGAGAHPLCCSIIFLQMACPNQPSYISLANIQSILGGYRLYYGQAEGTEGTEYI